MRLPYTRQNVEVFFNGPFTLIHPISNTPNSFHGAAKERLDGRLTFGYLFQKKATPGKGYRGVLATISIRLRIVSTTSSINARGMPNQHIQRRALPHFDLQFKKSHSAIHKPHASSTAPHHRPKKCKRIIYMIKSSPQKISHTHPCFHLSMFLYSNQIHHSKVQSIMFLHAVVKPSNAKAMRKNRIALWLMLYRQRG